MNVNLLNQIICKMSANRQYFYSEADFQHNLANALRRAGYTVYLEYPVGGYHIDIILEDNGIFYPIELKYKTCLTRCKDLFNNNTTLKNHGASDIARYSFWQDVYRIEQLKVSLTGRKFAEGYVIILTNDNKLWAPKAQKGIDQMFEIFQTNQVGTVEWTQTKNAPDYKAGNTWYKAFPLSKVYTVPQWNDYSTGVGGQNAKTKKEFKFLTITV